MKRLIFMLLTLFTITGAGAQNTLVQFKGDTLAYLKATFEQNKERFIGKPASVVIDEWRSQLPVKYIQLIGTSSTAREDSKRDMTKGLNLFYFTDHEVTITRFHAHQMTPYVMVMFAPPYYQKIWDLYKIRDDENKALGPKLYDNLKDYIVQDLVVTDF